MGCSRFLAFSVFEGKPNDLVDAFRLHDHLGAFGYWLKYFCQIQKLMGSDVHAFGSYLSGDGNHRSSVGVCVCNTGYQIGGAWAKGCQTYARLTGETSVHIRHKCSSLFVACGNKTNIGMIGKCFNYCQIFLSRNAEDHINSFFFQTFH